MAFDFCDNSFIQEKSQKDKTTQKHTRWRSRVVNVGIKRKKRRCSWWRYLIYCITVCVKRTKLSFLVELLKDKKNNTL